MNSTEDLISEYRVYVVDGEIRAICHYKGPEDTRSWKKKMEVFWGDVVLFWGKRLFRSIFVAGAQSSHIDKIRWVSPHLK